MSWSTILALAGGAYLFKALGLLVFGPAILRQGRPGDSDPDNSSAASTSTSTSVPVPVSVSTAGRSAGLMELGQLLPPALLAALVVSQTVVTDSELVVDARLAGVVAGAVAVWRKAPFWLVLVIAAAVSAAIRALSG